MLNRQQETVNRLQEKALTLMQIQEVPKKGDKNREGERQREEEK